MEIQKNVLLAPFTTFKIGGPAKFFCVVKDQFDALEAYEFAKNHQLPVFVLGGGSNLLVSDEGFNGLVVKVENKGIEVIDWVNQQSADRNQQRILLKVASGEVWDEVVAFSVKNNWWGLENLSHIPGSSGAIAVQNVGAYGQEAFKVIKSVTVFNTQTHQILELTNEQCQFAYRKSIFNTTEKGKYIIFYITLELSKISQPILTYRDLESRFKNQNPTISEIRQAVIEIRNKKYPFPTEAKLGNAGSFFKNINLNLKEFKALKISVETQFGAEYAQKLELKSFISEAVIKVPSAYLMELCGLKDLQVGGAKINHNQPLVIINETGTATAKDVVQLAQKIMESVYIKLGVKLTVEPELVGFTPNLFSDITKI
jgi:UDP-N-acetylmuramate dehydrogenase